MQSWIAAFALVGVVGSVDVHRADSTVSHDGHIEGFGITSTWAVNPDGSVTQHVLAASSVHATLSRDADIMASLSDFNATEGSKARTMLMMKLNLATWLPEYPADGDIASSVSATTAFILGQLVAQGYGVYSGPSGAGGTYVDDKTLAYQTVKAVSDEIVAESAEHAFQRTTNESNAYFNESAALNVSGTFKAVHPYIFAATWTSLTQTQDGRTASILVFRGANDPIDYAEGAMMSGHYISELGDDRVKDAWENEAGLNWTATQQYIRSVTPNEDDVLTSEGFIAAQFVYASLPDLAVYSYTTFAPVVWAMSAQFVAESLKAGHYPILTGYSIGGSRASSSSMFLKKQGLTVEAITFAGFGNACWTERVLSNVSFSSVVDSSVVHPQITDYAHPLDKFGNLQGGELGNQCTYGVDATSWPPLAVIANVCEKPLAFNQAYTNRLATGALLNATLNRVIAAATAAGDAATLAQIAALKEQIPTYVQTQTAAEQEILGAYVACQYLTHQMETVYLALSRELNDDGTTLGGCRAPEVPTCPVVPTEVPDTLAPTNAPATNAPPTSAPATGAPYPVTSDESFVNSDSFIALMAVIGGVSLLLAIGLLVFFMKPAAGAAAVPAEVNAPTNNNAPM